MRLTSPNPIQQMFDRICPRYDLMNHVLSLGLDFLWRRRAVRELGLKSGDSAVDLCCGTGDLSMELYRQVRPGRVVGVDFSIPMLARARRKYPWVEYLESDACQVPLEGGFQAATIAFGPRNIPDLQALWKEMARLVAPGGTVLALELTRPRGLMGFLHKAYMKLVVPWLGGWLSGDPQAYQYLSKTVQAFLEPEQLAESMRTAGLEEVRVIPLHGGLATLHLGRRPWRS